MPPVLVPPVLEWLVPVPPPPVALPPPPQARRATTARDPIPCAARAVSPFIDLASLLVDRRRG
jgi:hypothetical protein